MYNFERFEKMLLLIDSCNKKGKKQQQKHRQAALIMNR
jgi:hypothetical protein